MREIRRGIESRRNAIMRLLCSMLFEALFTKTYGIAISLVVAPWLALPKLVLRGLVMHVSQFGSPIIASLSIVGSVGKTFVGVVL